MKVLVTGNVNSGKSRFIDGFMKIHPSYTDLRIDEYRKKYGDGTIDREMSTQNMFISDVVSKNNVIAELSGLGFLGFHLSKKITPKTFVIVLVRTPPEVCIERSSEKDFSDIPFPYQYNSLEEFIMNMDEGLREDFEVIWRQKAIEIIEYSGNEEELPGIYEVLGKIS